MKKYILLSLMTLTYIILLSGCGNKGNDNDLATTTMDVDDSSSQESNVEDDKVDFEKDELLDQLNDLKKVNVGLEQKYDDLENEYYDFKVDYEKQDTELSAFLKKGVSQEVEQALLELNKSYMTSLEGFLDGSSTYSSESVNGIHLDMPYYMIDGYFEQDQTPELIMSVEDRYYFMKSFDGYEVLMDPLSVVSVKCWLEDSPSSFGFSIGDNFEEVLAYCRERYVNVDTPNGGKLFNWFHLTEDTCLIVVSDKSMPSNEQSETVTNEINLELIEICYLRSYN